MNKFERNLLVLIEKKIFLISYIVITIFAILLRLTGFHTESADFTAFLLPWFDELKAAGGLKGMATYSGNYNTPYIFLMAILTYLPIRPLWSIKLLSCIFDFIGAYFASRIVSYFNKGNSKNLLSFVTYTVVLFSPNVFLNSSYWAQCDFIYVSFLLMCIYFLIEKKYTLFMIAFGLSISFKLQAIFLFPILLIYYMKNKEFSILKFLLVPATLIITNLPNVIFGHKSIFSFVDVYYGQTDNTLSLSYNFPNVWFWFPTAGKVAFSRVAILVTLIMLAVMLVTIMTNKRKERLTEKDIISFALWSAMTCVLFLPFMHERYGFLVDILSIIYVFSFKKHWWIAVLLNMLSFFTYMDYLYSAWFYNYRDMAILYFATYLFFSLYVIKDFYKENTNLTTTESEVLNPS